MKKIIVIAAAVCALAACLASCGGMIGIEDAADDKKINIVTTIFPEYDWVRSIVGETDGAEVTMLLDNGVDMHSYQPAAKDIMKLSSCDLFIYVGGESDAWVDDALAEAVNPDMKVINLLDVLGDEVKQEEIVEGMKADDDELGYDEHVWLSLRNTQTIVKAITNELCGLDALNSDAYAKNASEYIDRLLSLDLQYEKTVASAARKVLLFGDRFPFRYLTDDYGIEYYAAFPGCEAETEASFETIVFLSSKIDELGLTSVMTIDGTDHSIAETVVQNTASKDQRILTLDSMQSTTSADIKNGAAYISIMEKNLETLQKALN